MPEIRYETYGPFEVPRGHKNAALARLKVDKRQLKQFWTVVDGGETDPRTGKILGENGLSKARGIYIFANSAGGGFTPWYVGKTNQNAGFRGECFGPHKLLHYNDILQNDSYTRGTPVMFLIARMNASGKGFSTSKSNDREIDWLEAELIQLALAANSELVNEKRTKFVRELVVPGVIGNDNTQLSRANKDLQRVLNLKTMKRKRRSVRPEAVLQEEIVETIIVPEAHDDFESDDSEAFAINGGEETAMQPILEMVGEESSGNDDAAKCDDLGDEKPAEPKSVKRKKLFGVF